MFLYSHTYACLSTGDTFLLRQGNGTLITQVTFYGQSHTLQSSLTDTRSNHRHISHNGTYLTCSQHIVKCFYRMLVYQQQIFHFKVGSSMNGMKHCPFLVKRYILVLQFLFNGTETIYHDFLANSGNLTYTLTVITARCNELPIAAIRL